MADGTMNPTPGCNSVPQPSLLIFVNNHERSHWRRRSFSLMEKVVSLGGISNIAFGNDRTLAVNRGKLATTKP